MGVGRSRAGCGRLGQGQGLGGEISPQPVRQALATGFRQVRPSRSVTFWSLSGLTHSVQVAVPKPGAYECALHLWHRRPSRLAKPAI